MASQSSTSSQRSIRKRGSLTCYCGEPPVLKCSKTKENPGRRFWSCTNYDIGRGCNFFSWADGDVAPAPQEAEIALLKMKCERVPKETRVLA
ncbi:hypothetical protein PIB30_061617 [Stylosanthes scabra]|uniref:GRF-type domain-containing protein n=1 Tax=Stylosanthes scabra TaxID=79078 RepID=A0ABU6ZJK4_9FABA|nr:hypothetical protein [Stylosanthes scabra]